MNVLLSAFFFLFFNVHLYLFLQILIINKIKSGNIAIFETWRR